MHYQFYHQHLSLSKKRQLQIQDFSQSIATNIVNEKRIISFNVQEWKHGIGKEHEGIYTLLSTKL